LSNGLLNAMIFEGAAGAADADDVPAASAATASAAVIQAVTHSPSGAGLVMWKASLFIA